MFVRKKGREQSPNVMMEMMVLTWNGGVVPAANREEVENKKRVLP